MATSLITEMTEAEEVNYQFRSSYPITCTAETEPELTRQITKRATQVTSQLECMNTGTCRLKQPSIAGCSNTRRHRREVRDDDDDEEGGVEEEEDDEEEDEMMEVEEVDVTVIVTYYAKNKTEGAKMKPGWCYVCDTNHPRIVQPVLYYPLSCTTLYQASSSCV